ncbi:MULTISPECIES: AMP-binding protein [unclassified Bradyrhizobium]|uniref:AMP-binding protein n=1 Tax=Bradyrhizobium sp. USDA 4541 TaxID=2817704 RepID=UPI0020A30A0E|nr:AMP-binding protein [Bradyrhizobium sp. USDA 4541]MCP1850158.1 acyl-CoA synthetase (AMP-forming)/AMP-acid ligase II [Bradyrhizobium sp. USDA 4541]
MAGRVWLRKLDPARIGLGNVSRSTRSWRSIALQDRIQRGLRVGADELTYKALRSRSDALARTLREHGAQGEVVGYWVSGTSTGRAVVAILKPASTYLPLDPSLPASRASFMIEQSRCALIIGPHQLDLLGLFQANGKGATQFMPMEAALRHRARLRLSCHHRTRTDSRTFCLRLARRASLRARNDRPRGPK